MKKYFLYACFFVFLLYACHNNKDNDNKEDISFNMIVDTSFYCDMTINGTDFLFRNHTNTYGYSRRPSGSDSIIFGFSLYFETENKEVIAINISKDFDVDNLGLEFENTSKPVPNNYLPSQTFMDIFSETNYNFAEFEYMNDGIWHDYFRTRATSGMGLNWFQITGGASFDLEIQAASYHSKFMGASISEDSIRTLNSLSFFEISDIDILNDCNLIIEGSFESYINDFGGTQLHLTCHHFKGYVENIIQPCR